MAVGEENQVRNGVQFDGALLSGTLKTYQRAACDDSIVTLKCPAGTTIIVEVAQYGTSNAAALCPDPSRPSIVPNATCLWPNALQYSLLQTVVETCQKKRQCKFKSSPKIFQGDPCPGFRKYTEVAYKCRPYEFRSKVACENEVLPFRCNPNSRIAIYSASFGRTEYESVSCPQPQGVPEETCLVSYATETVMHICHGKRNCSVSADEATFGNPCKYPSTRMYLKVVFTCVPRTVLRDHYGNTIEHDEIPESDEYMDNYDTIEDALRHQEMYSPKQQFAGEKQNNSQSDVSLTQLAPSPNDEVPPPGTTTSQFPPYVSHRLPKDMPRDSGHIYNNTITTANDVRVIGFISEWVQIYSYISKNKEKLILYWALSISGGLLSVLVLVISRLLWQRHRTRTSVTNTTLPSFVDDLSEIDTDIDLTTPATITILPTPSEVVRYGEANAPRSLSRSGNNQYYYG